MSILTAATIPARAQKFVAEHYRQSASIELNGDIDRVFPLFTMSGEKNWAAGWNPVPIYPNSGEMREGLIFQTPDHIHGGPPLTWLVSRYDERSHQIQYVVTSPTRVTFISVTCTPLSTKATRADIRYELTGLSSEGNEQSRHVLQKIFAADLTDWQTAINDYLK